MSPTLRAQLLQPSVLIGAAVVAAVVAIGIAFLYTNPSVVGVYVSVTQGSIVQEVDTTGTVEAAQTVDLSFEQSGRITYIGPAVGTHVSAGTTLASISAADAQAAYEQAKAALQVEQAKLDALNAGATPQDIAVAQTAVTGAQSALTQATQSLLSAAQNGYVASDDAVHNRVDQFFSNPRTASPSLAFSLTDSQLQASIVADRISMETLLTAWQAEVASLPQSAGESDATAAAATAQNNLAQVESFLDEVANGLTHVVPTTAYPTATIQGYESSIATARSNVSGAISALNAAQTAETSAASGLASAQSNLALTQAPATPQDIEEQTAEVASAQANVDAAAAELAKTSIQAPFAGTITVNNADLGATASPDMPLISMISDAQFQFETYVSQADLAKVKTGDSAPVELDAYENQTPFPAHVATIDPAATLQNGIASYKITLQFDTNDPRIQAGLTGSVKITTQTDTNVLSVPTSAIITEGSQQFVLKQTPSGDEQVQVQTGISSATGMTEILSGLSATDKVRTFGNQQ